MTTNNTARETSLMRPAAYYVLWDGSERLCHSFNDAQFWAKKFRAKVAQPVNIQKHKTILGYEYEFSFEVLEDHSNA